MRLWKAVPNVLSVSRIIASPFLAMLAIQGRWDGAFVVLAYVAVSDAVDGEVARKLKVSSRLGQILDTTGDIAYIVASVFGYLFSGESAAWFLYVVCVYAAIVVCKATLGNGLVRRVLACLALPYWLMLLWYLIWRFGTLGGVSACGLAISELFVFILVAFWKQARLKGWLNSR